MKIELEFEPLHLMKMIDENGNFEKADKYYRLSGTDLIINGDIVDTLINLKKLSMNNQLHEDGLNIPPMFLRDSIDNKKSQHNVTRLVASNNREKEMDRIIEELNINGRIYETATGNGKDNK